MEGGCDHVVDVDVDMDWFRYERNGEGGGISLRFVVCGVGLGLDIRCDSGLWSVNVSQELLSTSHWAMTTIVSLTVQNSSTAGVEPNGSLVSRYAMRSIMVMHINNKNI